MFIDKKEIIFQKKEKKKKEFKRRKKEDGSYEKVTYYLGEVYNKYIEKATKRIFKITY